MLEEFVLVVRLFHYELFDTYYIFRVISFSIDLIFICAYSNSFSASAVKVKLLKLFLETMEIYC